LVTIQSKIADLKGKIEEKEDDGWTYYCELRDSGDETLLGLLHGKGGDINSSQSLAEIIVEVCS